MEFFGFDYLFFADGGDVARARLELFDTGGNSLAHANILLTGTESAFTFQYVYAALEWTAAGIPARMRISFLMSNEEQVHMGSTLLVDNVIVNSSMLGAHTATRQQFQAYPTLTDGIVNIAGADAGAGYALVDMTGKTVGTGQLTTDGTIDVSGLSAGMYVLKVALGDKIGTVRIIRK